MPSVDVVIPCYKSRETIARTIASVASQTRRPDRVILVDDCSPDDSWNYLCTLPSAFPELEFTLHRLESNSGPGGARNAGWKRATGDYIAFLDSDDIWGPTKLEIQLAHMACNPDLVLSGHRGGNVDEGFDVASSYISPETQAKITPVGRRGILMFNQFITRSVMVRRDIPQRFDPAKRYCEDYLLWMQIIFDGGRAEVIELPLCFAFKADSGVSGLSANILRMEKGELDAYHRIFAAYEVGRADQVISVGFSLLKYLRREMRAQLRRLRGRQ
jgi:glycosyltransferase involved in cell wall biosynthesis